MALDTAGRPILETTENEPPILESRVTDLVRSEGGIRAWQLFRSAPRTDSKSSRHYSLAFPLVKHPSTNYYHWLLGYLEKVRALEAYETATGQRPTVLIAEDSPEWVRDSLRLAGVAEDQWVQYGGTLVTADRLVIPSHRSRFENFTPSPANCRWLRERLTANLPSDLVHADWPRRIYVSREDATDRRVRNRDAVDAILEEFGFTSCVLTDRSFAEQIALFSQADCIVGPHGAGLVNMLFATDTSVVEFFRSDQIRRHYFVLARQLSFEYQWLTGRSVGDDMILDETELRRVLATAVEP